MSNIHKDFALKFITLQSTDKEIIFRRNTQNIHHKQNNCPLNGLFTIEIYILLEAYHLDS
jgi:hypothetical protein